MKLKRVFALAWWASLLSASAQVEYSVVAEGGTYRDYTDGGNTAGVGSASYDYWISHGPWFAPPVSGFGDQSWDNEGAVLLAFNPYTGEVFTEIAANDQYFNPIGTYSGGGHSNLGTASSFAASGGEYPVAEDNRMPDNAISEDMIAFTTELRPDGGGNFVVGMYAQASADGAILGEFDPGHAGINTYNPYFLSNGETVGSLGSFDGEDIRVYCGYIIWGGCCWTGQFGGAGERGIGFEVDGHKGWARISVSGDRSGLILKEYYFEGATVDPPSSIRITEIVGSVVSNNLTSLAITFTSEVARVYAVDYKANLNQASWDEIANNVVGVETTTTWNSNAGAQLARSSGFYRIRAISPGPVVVFEDNFDGRNDLAPWTNSSPDGNPWELGVPTALLGPPTAFSAPNAVGTVLAGNYIASDTAGTFIVSSLRSPAISLSGIVSGTISYQRYVDMEDPQFDFATVNLLDATDDSLIEVLETDIGNGNLAWEAVSHDIPAAAIGKDVYIQIVFSSDNFDSFQTGLVIDDFKVEGVEP